MVFLRHDLLFELMQLQFLLVFIFNNNSLENAKLDFLGFDKLEYWYRY